MHVIPPNDLIDHEPTDECPCGPTTTTVPREDRTVGWIVEHHPLRREAPEPDR